MTQDWNLPADTNEVLSAVVVTNLPNALLALRSIFSGTTAPTATTPYMLWLDTSGTGTIKQRNAADTDWVAVAPALAQWTQQTIPCEFGSVAATTTKYLAVMPRKGNVRRVAIVSATTTTGSVAATTEWDFMLSNVTDTVDLFSGTPGTATSVGGVGGGSEITADTAYVLTPDQNALVDQNDVLEFTITKVGSPTSPITRVWVFLDIDAIPE